VQKANESRLVDEDPTVTTSSPQEEEKSWPSLLGSGSKPTPARQPVLLSSGWSGRSIASLEKKDGATAEEKWPSLPATQEKANPHTPPPPTPVNSNKQNKKSQQQQLFWVG